MVIVAANLMSRWCRNVTLVLPPVTLDPRLGFGKGSLADFVLVQMRDADPFGRFAVSGTPITSDITLMIGPAGEAVTAPRNVFIDATGWLAGIRNDQPVDLPFVDDENPLGPIGAACLGVAQAFKIATWTPSDRYFREGIFDLFSLCWREHVTELAPPWPADFNIGRVLMVGAGSVGSGAAYCLRLARLAGHLAIIDKDEVKIENFNRSPIFGRATFGMMKSQAVAQFLAHSPLAPEPFPFWWNEFVETRGCRGFDVWLPLANEFNVRLSMQSNFPPLMIHASTSANWGVNHGRHIPGRDDCLADRFPTEVKRDDLTCATGQVTTPNQEAVDAALPFASLFAGLLITADLVRAQLPGYPQVANFALFDWYGTMDAIQAWDRKPRPGCMCREQTRKFHARLNGGTRHWPMFGFVER